VHYARQSWRHSGHYKRAYPKLSALCDTRSHLFLSAVVDRGPKPDVVEFEAALTQALARHPFDTLLADAGYESERAHVLCRETLGVRSIFPTTRRGRRLRDGRPGPIRTRYRLQLYRSFPRKTYGQRWQVEAAFSMLKRHLGSALRSRRPFALNREVLLKVITHNLMILWCLFGCFQRSRTEPIYKPRRSAIFAAFLARTAAGAGREGAAQEARKARDETLVPARAADLRAGAQGRYRRGLVRRAHP
jgi:hypothetical protein